MKRKVTIELEIDPFEYFEAEDTPQGAVQLVKEILSREADMPPREKIRIMCDGKEDVITV
jgi:hypothetical protein